MQIHMPTHPDQLNQKFGEWGPEASVMVSSPGDSEARSSFRAAGVHLQHTVPSDFTESDLGTVEKHRLASCMKEI